MSSLTSTLIKQVYHMHFEILYINSMVEKQIDTYMNALDRFPKGWRSVKVVSKFFNAILCFNGV
jgi:hypothetical protein